VAYLVHRGTTEDIDIAVSVLQKDILLHMKIINLIKLGPKIRFLDETNSYRGFAGNLDN
jgi:hypothetical protein